MSKPLFEVIVVATMSAGKSTVINALIGKELLHSANEATTATITRIHDKDDLPFFSGNAYSYQNTLIAEQNQLDATTLKRWNADPKIKTIDIVGNIQALHNDAAELVIYDTPGPNNSQDDNHEALTMEVINDGNYGLILYVLNATQIGVNDDRSLLEKIRKSLDNDRHKEIIFLLNKADCLDEEKGEHLDEVVERVNKYLTEIGFKTPTIIPSAANYALVLEKVMSGEKITRSERAELKQALEQEHTNFIRYSTISEEDKQKVLLNNMHQVELSQLKWFPISEQFFTTETRLRRTIARTGFGVIQYLLQQKLAKHH